jgi:polyisoprenoid-binding protein YceI
MIKTTLRAALIAAAALSAPFAAQQAAANTYEFDPAHTEVRVAWVHAGFSVQTAEFHTVGGTVTLDEGAIADAGANVTVAVDSIDTGVSALDDHLKSADFFEAETFPEITFVATGVEQTGEKTAKVTGDLTLKGVTKPVVFDAQIVNIGAHPLGQFMEQYQGQWLGFTATATINRADWGMDNFIPAGSDEIEITVSSEMKAAAEGQVN